MENITDLYKILDKTLNSDNNPFKKAADKYGVELVDAKSLIEGDATSEYILSVHRILTGIMKMGIRVCELSIPSMIGIIDSLISMGPKNTQDFAVIMIKEFKKFKEERSNED